MTPHDTLVRSDAVVSRLIGGDTLVVPVRGGVGDLASIYSFNAVGTTIWGALAQPTSMQELASLIEREYEIGRDQAEQDLALFLGEMCSAGLITVKSSCEAAALMPEPGDVTTTNSW
ncbi:MAG: PqqD family protein [Acidobacteriia bacterium]|nr:PqqD family protein [Terriglobia bacterium]